MQLKKKIQSPYKTIAYIARLVGCLHTKIDGKFVELHAPTNYICRHRKQHVVFDCRIQDSHEKKKKEIREITGRKAAFIRALWQIWQFSTIGLDILYSFLQVSMNYIKRIFMIVLIFEL